MNKITAQVGQIIEVNGKQYRATESGFELVLKRGPLGGELVCIEEIEKGKEFYLRGYIKAPRKDLYQLAYVGFDGFEYEAELHCCITVETNIPPRPTFTPMTAGEAAALPDIVGRWVAGRIGRVDSVDGSDNSLCCQEFWFDRDDQILLIEGANL